MAKNDIVVIGTSAGGVEALSLLVSRLPSDLRASVFVVLHIGPGIDGRSYLPEILNNAGPLQAVSASHLQEIREGIIYVAPPDFHLLVRHGHVELSHGPKENRTRPGVNPLFRSAAAAYPGRVTGVILTGMLDDGVAGLAEIKRRGGAAIVQDPSTAAFPDMPENAIQKVDVDYVGSIPQIAGIIAELSKAGRTATETEVSMQRIQSKVTCPECRGPLWEERQGTILEYRCRVGHVYSQLSLEREHEETVERTLWSAIVALEEAAEVLEQLPPDLAIDRQESARKKREQAANLKVMLNQFE